MKLGKSQPKKKFYCPDGPYAKQYIWLSYPFHTLTITIGHKWKGRYEFNADDGMRWVPK